MKNTAEIVKKAAHLAKIKLTDEEITQISEYFVEMEEFVSVINKYQPSDVVFLETSNYVSIDDLREDIPGKTIDKQEALGKANYHDKDYFIIHKQARNVQR